MTHEYGEYGMDALVAAAKRSLVSVLCRPAVGSAIRAVSRGRIRNRGFVVDTNNEYVSPRNVALLFWGLYERAEVVFVERFLRDDLDVVELGSSLGVVSLHIARAQGEGQKLICVEANPFLTRTIRGNFNANFGSRKEAMVINRAISYDGREEISFLLSEDNLLSRMGSARDQRTARVTVTTLSGILRDYGVGDFSLVCDIEGAEAGLILKDAEALSRCRQMIIELHQTTYDGRPYSVEDLRAKIESTHGFRSIASQRTAHHDVFAFEKASKAGAG